MASASSSSSSSMLDPLSIFLVKTGGRGGQRVLFRYPYTMAVKRTEIPPHCHEFSLLRLPSNFTTSSDLSLSEQDLNRVRLCDENLVAFRSKFIANLFAVSPSLCDKKFELKVDGIRFVGHPRSITSLPEEEEVMRYVAEVSKDAGGSRRDDDRDAAGDATPDMASLSLSSSPRDSTKELHSYPPDSSSSSSSSNITMFVVVVALNSQTSYPIVKSYHELAKDIAQAIRNEEMRSGYLRREAEIMIKAQDEVSAMAPEEKPTSAFSLVETRSELAREMTKVFKDVKNTGTVQISFNGYSEVLFCLPQKVHKTIIPTLFVEPELLREMSSKICPFHAMLLLYPKDEVLADLPADCNNGFRDLIVRSSPRKNMLHLSEDLIGDKQFVWEMACKLVYWGKATFIHTLCDNSQFILSPYVANHYSTALKDKFAEKFPQGENLLYYLKLLSLPTPVGQLLPTTASHSEIRQLNNVLVWMLQNHLLMQMHKYVRLNINDNGEHSPLPDPRDPADLEERDEVSILMEETERPDDKYPPVETCVEEEMAMGIVGEKIRMKSRQELLDGFSNEEKSIILASPGAETPEDLALFARCAPYFRNGYNVEEIMYWENLRRFQILSTADKFRDILVVEEREDPKISDYFRKAFRTTGN